MMSSGVRHGDLFTVTLPAHARPTNREHSWRYDWIKTVIAAMNNIEADGDSVVVRVDFATGPPHREAPEGSVAIKSYESGGEILRFMQGQWVVVGRQPARRTLQ